MPSQEKWFNWWNINSSKVNVFVCVCICSWRMKWTSNTPIDVSLVKVTTLSNENAIDRNNFVRMLDTQWKWGKKSERIKFTWPRTHDAGVQCFLILLLLFFPIRRFSKFNSANFKDCKFLLIFWIFSLAWNTEKIWKRVTFSCYILNFKQQIVKLKHFKLEIISHTQTRSSNQIVLVHTHTVVI